MYIYIHLCQCIYLSLYPLFLSLYTHEPFFRWTMPRPSSRATRTSSLWPIYIYIYINMYIHLYIYRERKRARSTYMYILPSG